MPEIAGYHLYWTPPLTTPDGARATTKGPLRDDTGRTVVLMPDVGQRRLQDLVPDLIAGTYLLVPVDEKGRELPLAEPIRTEVVDQQQSEVLRAVLGEAARVFMQRVHADPELTAAYEATMSSPDRQSVLAKALQQGDPGMWSRFHAPERPDADTHQRLVNETAALMINALRDVSGASTGSTTFRLDRESYGALMRQPALVTLDHVRDALARADHGDAAVRSLARLSLGEDLPADDAAKILCGIERLDVFLCLIRHASGNRPSALHKLLAQNRLPSTWEGSEQKALTLFALWHLGPQPQTQPVVRRWLRRLLREVKTERATGLLAWLVKQLDALDVHQVAADVGLSAAAGMPEAMAVLATDLLRHADIDEIVAALPQRAVDPPLPGGVMRRSPKTRPNELCPCGSGKKFKKCHAGPAIEREAVVDRATVVREHSSRLAPEHVRALARTDLANLEVSQLRDASLVEVLRYQLDLGDWHRAVAALDEVGRRPSVEDAFESLRWSMVDPAFRAGLWPIVAQLAARRSDGDDDAEQLVLALAERRPDALDRLAHAAHDVVTEGSGVGANTLAHILLATVPPLGVLVARGAMRADELDTAAVILGSIDEIRDDLLLAPRDPAHAVFELLGGSRERQVHADEVRKQVSAEAEQLRRQLEAKTARLTELEQEAARREHELREAERAADDAARRPSPTNAGENRAHREKIERLEALLREKNEELAESRRGLAAATASTTRPRSSPPVAIDADDPDTVAVSGELVAVPRAVLVPRYAARAAGALGDVPHHVGAAAARAVGGLAAGDEGLWRGVKQAKDMPRQVLMARIGIHHRLLFRVEDSELEVIDLVTRENLDTTLKRLRER